MRRPIGTLAAAITAAVVATAFVIGPAFAAKWGQVGHWRFNEGPNASTAIDSANGLSGSIGSNVRTGVTGNKRTYYNFPSDGIWGGPGADRLVLVPDHPSLDPESGTYRVTIVFRTHQSSANLVQKGQSNTYGGFWKIETHNGDVTCLFRGSGDESSGVGSRMRVTDGRWHKVVCTRYPDRVEMSVDGTITDIRRSPSGNVSNIKQLSIGGKAECGGSVGCDYFTGDIDRVRIVRK